MAILFKDRRITIHDLATNQPVTLWASVALGRGLAAVYRNAGWCIAHLASGQILAYSAFERQEQAERYIVNIINVLDWRNDYKAITTFLSRPEKAAALIRASQEAWAA
jgi:hypothetical protein